MRTCHASRRSPQAGPKTSEPRQNGARADPQGTIEVSGFPPISSTSSGASAIAGSPHAPRYIILDRERRPARSQTSAGAFTLRGPTAHEQERPDSKRTEHHASCSSWYSPAHTPCTFLLSRTSHQRRARRRRRACRRCRHSPFSCGAPPHSQKEGRQVRDEAVLYRPWI